MTAERLQPIVQQLQREIGQQVAGNGSITLHFQNGKVQAVEVLQHARVTAAVLVNVAGDHR